MLIDPLTGAATVVVGSRQGRPNLPADACPFCVGGIESPEPYEVRAFVNRLPAMPDDRCEVVLYTSRPRRDLRVARRRRARAASSTCGPTAARRSARRGDIAYVLVFENRGAEVGATIAHPHGQIYAFDLVPPARRELRATSSPTALPRGRTADVASSRGMECVGAVCVVVAVRPPPRAGRADEPDLPSLTPPRRTELAALLVDVLARLDRLYDRPLPYMLWFHQRPFDGREWDGPPLHAHLVSPWRDAGVARYIAAGELGCEVFFNPVAPEACRGRAAGRGPHDASLAPRDG